MNAVAPLMAVMANNSACLEDIKIPGNTVPYDQNIQDLPAAIYMCDTEGRITYYNKLAATMWGREPKIGKELWCGSWRMYTPDGRPLAHAECPMAMTIKEGRPIDGRAVVVERPDGNRFTVLPNPYPLRNTSGEITGAVNMVVDITDCKQAENEQHGLQKRLRLAIRSGNVGLWDWDLKTNQVYYSPEWKQQIGFADNEIGTGFEEWRDRVHPEDIEHCLQKIKEYVEDSSAGYYIEFRFRHRDGSYRWILAQGERHYDEDGHPIRMIGSHVDITPLREAEQTSAENEIKISHLLARRIG